ncbi:hypothetical protein RQP46_005525 [Phenoliferia psychrophenolica]
MSVPAPELSAPAGSVHEVQKAEVATLPPSAPSVSALETADFAASSSLPTPPAFNDTPAQVHDLPPSTEPVMLPVANVEHAEAPSQAASNDAPAPPAPAPLPLSTGVSHVEPALAPPAAVPSPTLPIATNGDVAPVAPEVPTPAPVAPNGIAHAEVLPPAPAHDAPPPSLPVAVPAPSEPESTPAPAPAPAPIPTPTPAFAPAPLAHPSVLPPPPIVPLPSLAELQQPPAVQRTDSTIAQPPTPAALPIYTPPLPPAPTPVVAPTPEPTPAPVQVAYQAPVYQAPSEDVTMREVKAEESVYGEQNGKRPAPEETLAQPGGDDSRDVKRARVDELPVAPPADPYAYGALPVAPAPPTISPSDIHHYSSAAPTPVPQPQPTTPAPMAVAPLDDNAAPPSSSSQQGEGPVQVMTKAQQKFGLQCLRTLKKNRSAPPFLAPVDPVALLIPDYFRVVTHPIDLGTIEKNLNNTGKAMQTAAKYGRVYGLDYSGIGEWEGKLASQNVSVTHYRTAQDLRDDIERVWENCFKYNGPKDKNPVSAMAGALQEVADKLFRTMPPAPAIEYKPEPPRLPSPEIMRKQPSASSNSNSQSFVPTIRRSEDGNRPKREIHAPARELPYEQTDGGKSRHGRVSGKTAQEQLRYCKEVIKELFKKIHEPYAYPFYEPVNYVALNIPQYPSIVRKPMDLGTVRAKLEQNLYPSPAYGPFENDVRQVFKNCYLFNPPGTAVNEWGHRLEGVFEDKWDVRPMGDDDDDGSEDEGITEMERQLQTLQAEIEARKAQKKFAKEQKRAAERVPKPPKPSTSKPKVASGSGSGEFRQRASTSSSAHRAKRPSGGNGKKNGKKARKHDSSDEDDEDMMPAHQAPAGEVSFEMKRELAVKIVSFEGDNLERAIEIIRQGRPDLLSDVNKEIELDIDQLDQRTLLALYRFVCPGSATARKPPKAANRRSATGGTKRKNLDEIKESERIEALEKRLREFEGGAPPPAQPDSRRNSAAADADQASSDSSSEDGSSASDSEDDE